MNEFPHRYAVTANVRADEYVELSGAGLTPIESAPPAEFDGPGDRWSPEMLLVAAVADCFVLTFKAIARASSLDWSSLSCEVDGILDRVNNVTQFTEMKLRAVLDVGEGTDEKRALRLLEKSEQSCLITNSLKSKSHLAAEVRVAARA